MPTLVVNGEHESKTVFVHAEKIKELIEDCEVVIISNAGHTSNLENSKEFNRVIEDFLTKKGWKWLEQITKFCLINEAMIDFKDPQLKS